MVLPKTKQWQIKVSQILPQLMFATKNLTTPSKSIHNTTCPDSIYDKSKLQTHSHWNKCGWYRQNLHPKRRERPSNLLCIGAWKIGTWKVGGNRDETSSQPYSHCRSFINYILMIDNRGDYWGHFAYCDSIAIVKLLLQYYCDGSDTIVIALQLVTL